MAGEVTFGNRSSSCVGNSDANKLFYIHLRSCVVKRICVEKCFAIVTGRSVFLFAKDDNGWICVVAAKLELIFSGHCWLWLVGRKPIPINVKLYFQRFWEKARVCKMFLKNLLDCCGDKDVLGIQRSSWMRLDRSKKKLSIFTASIKQRIKCHSSLERAAKCVRSFPVTLRLH